MFICDNFCEETKVIERTKYGERWDLLMILNIQARVACQEMSRSMLKIMPGMGLHDVFLNMLRF